MSTYNLTTLYRRRAEHLLILMYKKSRSDMDILNHHKPKIELRSKSKVKFKYAFTDKTKVQKSPLYRGIFLWDQLSFDIQTLDDINIFKRNIHSLLDTGQIVYINCQWNNERQYYWMYDRYVAFKVNWLCWLPMTLTLTKSYAIFFLLFFFYYFFFRIFTLGRFFGSV